MRRRLPRTTGARVLVLVLAFFVAVIRFSKTDWSNYTQTGDYSFDPTRTAFADWSRVTLHRSGALVWGVAPYLILAIALAFAGMLAVPFAAVAAGTDELWEISSQMNMPGLPPGMGASTQQICQDKDPAKQAVPGQDMDKCKVTDKKQTGTRMTVTVSCPDGKGVIEQTYNAARTEFKSTVRMTTREGEMTMNMSGRKIGSCDAQQARGEREEHEGVLGLDEAGGAEPQIPLPDGDGGQFSRARGNPQNRRELSTAAPVIHSSIL